MIKMLIEIINISTLQMGKMGLKKIKQLAQALPFASSLHLCSVSHQAVLVSNCSVQQGRRWDCLQQTQTLSQPPRDSSSFQASGSLFPTLGDPRPQLFQDTSGSSANQSQLVGGPSPCG